LAQKWRKKYGIDIICDGAFLFLLGSRFYRSDFPDWREISATLKRIYLISDVTGRDGQVSDNGIMGPESIEDLGFTWSWFLWVFGTGLLIATGWSVRNILWFGAQESQRPACLYRTTGWLAAVQSFFWALACLRVI
jgi:hypothetical protein